MVHPDNPSRTRTGNQGRWRPAIVAKYSLLTLLAAAIIVAAGIAVSSILVPGSRACAITPTVASTVAAAATAVPLHIVEQYKIYLADLAAFGAQQASTQTFYLSIVSALIAVLSFKDAIRPLRDFVAPASILIFLLVAAVCVAWSLTVLQLASVTRAKFEVIREMEAAFPALYPMFTRQTQYFACGVPSWAQRAIFFQFSLLIIVGVAAFAFALAGVYLQIRNWLRGGTATRAETVLEPWLKPPS